LWNQYIKDYFVITADIQHIAGTAAVMMLAIIAQSVLAIVAKPKKNRTVYEST